jgi:hypothetical protein
MHQLLTKITTLSEIHAIGAPFFIASVAKRSGRLTHSPPF